MCSVEISTSHLFFFFFFPFGDFHTSAAFGRQVAEAVPMNFVKIARFTRKTQMSYYSTAAASKVLVLPNGMPLPAGPGESTSAKKLNHRRENS